MHNKADMTLVTSPQMKEEMEANGVSRVEVWRKGVDTEVFNPAFKSEAMRAELSDGHPEDPLLIYVGRLGSEKRLQDLREVLGAIPEARLAIVGKGPAEAELKDLFKGVPRVKFMGTMQGDPLSQAFASADIFVMPSDSETLGEPHLGPLVSCCPSSSFSAHIPLWLVAHLGFVVIESMASGTPVVGARAGGIPSIINDGKTSLLANPRDPKDFTEKVPRKVPMLDSADMALVRSAKWMLYSAYDTSLRLLFHGICL